MQAIYRHGTRTSVDHIAGGTIVPGQVVVVGVMIGVATHAAETGELCALDTTGVFEVVKITEDDIDPGETVYWDENGTPQGSIATDGAASSNSALGLIMGIAVERAGSDDAETVMVDLNQQNAVAP